MSALNFILCILLGLGSGLLLSYWMPEVFCAQKLCLDKKAVYVDAERVIHHVIRELKNNNVREEEMEKAVLESKSKFDKELKDYSQSHNAIIFSSPKALAGAENVTDYFIERLP